MIKGRQRSGSIRSGCPANRISGALCIPALVVHGATDLQIPAEDALRLGAALRETGNRDVTVHIFPNVDHVLLADRSGDWRHYVALPSLIAPAPARGLIADWLV